MAASASHSYVTAVCTPQQTKGLFNKHGACLSAVDSLNDHGNLLNDLWKKKVVKSGLLPDDLPNDCHGLLL